MCNTHHVAGKNSLKNENTVDDTLDENVFYHRVTSLPTT